MTSDLHPRATLSLAHSADADDVFMWWPLTGKIDPRNPSRVLAPPVLDTAGLRFVAVPEDIQALNARASTRADLDITAISMFTYPAVRERYILSACGWSLGDGFGPKLVVARDSPVRDPLELRGERLAVPGIQTTANFILSLLLGSTRERPTFDAAPMRFDQIASAVARGDVRAGVLIHESQIDFEPLGLRALADLGVWWRDQTGLPLPLGANVVRRDLDHRFGPGTLARVGALLRASIAHALANRAEGLAYARTFAPPIDDAALDRYVAMYVSPLTLDPRPRGVNAVRELFRRAAATGFAPDPGPLDLI
ncbi:MAG: menaquinone biosynthesis family protein [Phycisphaerales bacterium]